MSVRDVRNAFTRTVADGKIDAKEVDQVLESAGQISEDEERALQTEGDKYAGSMEPDAQAKLSEKLGEVGPLRRQAATINREVQAMAPALSAEAKAKLAEGVATQSYGGSEIPEAVKKLVNAALADGVAAYDVREMKGDPVYDTSHAEPAMIIDGKFNPYAQDQDASDTMAFDYTEVTPDKIAAEMATTQTWRELNGYEGTGNQQVAKFKDVTGKPSGNITALYDEARWPDTKARGPGGQKWANNFAILADGSVHCVPASRRTAAEPWRILTTASLARGKHMLFNGHLNMQNGVVTYVGMSGRLCKLDERGEAKFVDPIELLKAWGFKVAPGLTVTKEG